MNIVPNSTSTAARRQPSIEVSVPALCQISPVPANEKMRLVQPLSSVRRKEEKNTSVGLSAGTPTIALAAYIPAPLVCLLRVTSHRIPVERAWRRTARPARQPIRSDQHVLHESNQQLKPWLRDALAPRLGGHGSSPAGASDLLPTWYLFWPSALRILCILRKKT